MAEEMSASAHSSSSGAKPASGCVVLRVKRKREEDPADALGGFILMVDGWLT